VAPHTTDASTIGVLVQADYPGTPSSSAAGGVNLYPVLNSFPGVNVSAFSNSYAMRVDMFLVENGNNGGSILGTTEYAMVGINHSGNDTNWFDNSAQVLSGWTFDGLFYGIEADGANLGDYVLYSAPPQAFYDPTNYAAQVHQNFTNIFKNNPWTSGAGAGGAPANQITNGASSWTGLTPSWATVEVDQIITKSGTNVTLKINNVTVIAYTNNLTGTEAFTQGNIMLGYNDAYNGSGCCGKGVIYDNLTVTQLVLKITSIQVASGTVTISFTWSLDEPASVFALQSSASAVTPFSDVAATIVRTGVGTYTATLATSGTVQFYQVRHK
jgi:hypothetical protein